MNGADIVQFKDVSFSWSQKPLLHVPNFTLARGEKVLLRGASGSGKSTFLSLISGVLSPTSGEIQILGEDFTRKSPAQKDQLRANHMGYVFQLFNLLPYLSAEENILLALSFSKRKQEVLVRRGVSARDEARRLLSALGLDADAIAQQKAANLSVGQQQRVAVARALIGEPELLLADEPSSALDYEAREAFLRLMFAECKRANTALVFVSHDPNLSAEFDRTIEVNAFTGMRHVHH